MNGSLSALHKVKFKFAHVSRDNGRRYNYRLLEEIYYTLKKNMNAKTKKMLKQQLF